MMFIYSEEMKLQIWRYLLKSVTLCFFVSSAYDFQRNRCARNAEMLGIREIQFSIESM